MQICGLTKRYGGLTVYENFDLTLEEGKITCILGESGSGKTTLLNCIARLTDCAGQLPAVKCAYVFQSPRLVPNLTVRGNLLLVCKDEAAVDAMLERVSLSDKKNSYPAALSGGQAQRAAIARAFIFGGDIILMDEPFNSLDIKLKMQISSLFSEIQRECGRTALVVTHDADEALNIADRIIILKNGKIFYDRALDGARPRGGNGCAQIRREIISALLE